MDKRPFGTYIAYGQVENMFSRNTIRNKKQAFTKTWNEISDTASLYVCLAPALYVNDEEVKAMMQVIQNRTTLFLDILQNKFLH